MGACRRLAGPRRADPVAAHDDDFLTLVGAFKDVGKFLARFSGLVRRLRRYWPRQVWCATIACSNNAQSIYEG